MIQLSLLTTGDILFHARYYLIAGNIGIGSLRSMLVKFVFRGLHSICVARIFVICDSIIFPSVLIVVLILSRLIRHFAVYADFPYTMDRINIAAVLVFYDKIQAKRGDQAFDQYSFILLKHTCEQGFA